MSERNYPPKRWVWLTELIQKHGWKKGVEVGVKEGENISYLLRHNPDLFMYAVDPWCIQPEETETYENWNMGSVYKTFLSSVSPFMERVEVIRKFSVEAANDFNDHVDFVFIDAQHNYKNCLADIAAWRNKCDFISGHDYWEMFPGIEKAVNESFPKEQIILGPNTCWAVWKP
jgi:hypothetical protein